LLEAPDVPIEPDTFVRRIAFAAAPVAKGGKGVGPIFSIPVKTFPLNAEKVKLFTFVAEIADKFELYCGPPQNVHDKFL
jgi:hypothetical protein